MSVPVSTKSRLDSLCALRDDLTGRMAGCASDQNFAVMGRLLVDVLNQIEAAEKSEPESKGTALDELAAKRRAARRPDASGKAGASREAK